MRLLASDLMTYFRPCVCELRVRLREKSEPEGEPSAFEEILRELGRRHEQQHLATLGQYADLSGIKLPDRFSKTVEAITAKAAVVYQPAFTVRTKLNGIDAEIVGLPDYLIRDGNGYAIRDSKLSRHIDEKSHPEIKLQIQLYGWLFEQTTKQPPERLQVHSGTGVVIDIQNDGGNNALELLGRMAELRQLGEAPYEPVGWSKCNGCGFFERCWKAAETLDDVALLMDVDQGLARALHAIGVHTPQQLLKTFTAEKLAEFTRPWGKNQKRVGKPAERILQLAEVAITKQDRVLANPNIPDDANFVMFDLEGMPPYLDETDQIYLWGMQVFGAKPTQYMAATAEFGENGDKPGWLAFLRLCGELFNKYGDIRFIHWAAYEKTNITRYIERYGDPDGIAAKVRGSLLDLYTVAKNSLLLPLPSFSLKIVEKHVGYKRTQTEYGGDWSMAKFIEATETNDEAKRREVMDEILKYNREDLEAMWAVFDWLRSKKVP